MAHVIGELLRGVWRSQADQIITLEGGFEVRLKLPELLAASEDFARAAEGIYDAQAEASMHSGRSFPSGPRDDVVAEIERGLKLAFVEWLAEAGRRFEEVSFVLRWSGVDLPALQALHESEPGRTRAMWHVLSFVAHRNEAADRLRLASIVHSAQHDGDSAELVREAAQVLPISEDAVAYVEAALSVRNRGKAATLQNAVRSLTKEY